MSHKHRWPVLHHTANALGLLFRLVPYRWRFNAARYLAMILHPLIQRTAMCRAQVAMGLDTSREVTLFVVLRTLTRMGVTFDVKARNTGERFERGDGGALIACAHTTLCYAMFRQMTVAGLDPVVIEQTPSPLLGTKEFPQGIDYNHLLVRARSRLKCGSLVASMIDRADPIPGRTVTFELPSRSLHIATPLLDIAKATGADIWFCCARANTFMKITLAWERGRTSDLLGQFETFLIRELPSSHATRRRDDHPHRHAVLRWTRMM